MNAGLCSAADDSDHAPFIHVPSFYYSGATLEAMAKSVSLYGVVTEGTVFLAPT